MPIGKVLGTRVTDQGIYMDFKLFRTPRFKTRAQRKRYKQRILREQERRRREWRRTHPPKRKAVQAFEALAQLDETAIFRKEWLDNARLKSYDLLGRW